MKVFANVLIISCLLLLFSVAMAEDNAKSTSEQKISHSAEIPADFELKSGSYDLVWDADAVYRRSGAYFADPGNASDLGIIKTPSFASKKPLFTKLKLDGNDENGSVLIALDESVGTGEGYDTAYIDVNRNRDLTDDKAVLFDFDKNYVFQTPWVKVNARQGNQINNPLQIYLEMHKKYGKHVYLLYFVKGTWKAKVASNNGLVELALTDYDCNGHYGDLTQYTGEYIAGGDYAFINPLGQQIKAIDERSIFSFHLKQICSYNSKFFRIKISEADNKLIIQPNKKSSGSLSFKLSGILGQPKSVKLSLAKLIVSGENKEMHTLTYPASGELSLPTEKYRILQIIFTARPPKGKDVILTCDVSPTLEAQIEAGSVCTITVGGKTALAIEPGLDKAITQPGVRQVIKLEPKIGDNLIVKRVVNLPPPGVEILDKHGKIIKSQKAEYT